MTRADQYVRARGLTVPKANDGLSPFYRERTVIRFCDTGESLSDVLGKAFLTLENNAGGMRAIAQIAPGDLRAWVAGVTWMSSFCHLRDWAHRDPEWRAAWLRDESMITTPGEALALVREGKADV